METTHHQKLTRLNDGSWLGACSFCQWVWMVQRPIATKRVFVCPKCAEQMKLVKL